METVNNFKDYEIISMSNGYKYERWGKYYLKRPDPLIIWPDNEDIKVDAEYTRSNTGGGEWKVNSKMPSSWQVRYEDMVFNLKLMGFKHTGLFPEQAYNWNIIRETIRKSNRKVNVLNLFAYTGGASIAALMEHANVTHVDSSRGMIDWAKENVIANHLNGENIKFYIDDVKKLMDSGQSEIALMDPPSFGRGAKNEVWQVSKDLYNLILDCSNLLSDDALLFIVNTYTEGLSKTVIENILKKTIKRKGTVVGTELGIEARNGLVLPCGVTVRWECNGR